MSQFIVNFRSPDWRMNKKYKNISIQGHLYIDEKPVTPERLSEFISPILGGIDLSNALKRLNGFYAWVDQVSNQLRAGVDHIRSRPLFYSQTQTNFYLSDDAEWVRQQVGDEVMDPLAREEFLLAGYVTGSDTLFPNVKQLQAGECLIARQTEMGIKVETHRFYRFLHEEPKTYSEPHLRAELGRVTQKTMQRLIDHANGRQIVIPLSGGYDSRLIASMLKKLGYANVLCFTYGVLGNTESQYSKQVAESLGFSWVFIEYSKDLWRKEWYTPEAKAYRQMASGHVSLPHVQDWLAVKNLVAERRIDKDAIFVPGHSGDFVAGSHIPNFVFEKRDHFFKDVINSIIDNHLSNCPKKEMQLAKLNKLEERIIDRISLSFDGSDVSFANIYESWDCQERQAKYIVNSVRVYDQFKYEWWLPQWDLEFVQFWERVPLSLRKNRIWFKRWIQQQYAEVSGDIDLIKLKNASEAMSSESLSIKIAKRIALFFPSPLIGKLKKYRQLKIYRNHFLAFQGLISDEQLSLYLSKDYNIIGIYSDVQINGKW